MIVCFHGVSHQSATAARLHDKTTCSPSLTADKSYSQANASLLPGRHPAFSAVTKHSSAGSSNPAPCWECPPQRGQLATTINTVITGLMAPPLGVFGFMYCVLVQQSLKQI